MAVNPVRLSAKHQLAIALETSPGVMETLDEGDVLFIPNELSFKTELDQKERKLVKPFLGADPPTPGLKKCTVSISLDMIGSGTPTTPPPWAILMTLLGFKGSAGTNKYTWTLESTPAIATATVWSNRGGLRRRGRGLCAVSGKISGEVGRPAELSVELQGAYDGYEDAEPFSQTLPRPVPPVVNAGAFTLGGSYSPFISKWELTIANTLAWRIKPDASSLIYFTEITSRRFSVTLAPEIEALSTRDWLDSLESMTEEALEITIGSEAGNKFRITAPNAVVVKAGEENDEEGKMTDAVELLLTPSYETGGNDEITIEQL